MPNRKLNPETSKPRNEMARIGNDENDTKVSSAAFIILRGVHDDAPISRCGRWYGTLVSRNPLHAIRPNVRRLRSLHWRNASSTGRVTRQKLPVPPFGYVGIAKRRTSA